MPNPAAIAYEAYCKSTGGVSLVSGDKLPRWSELRPEIQKAWMDAAQAVIRTCRPLLNDVREIDMGKYPNYSEQLTRPLGSD